MGARGPLPKPAVQSQGHRKRTPRGEARPTGTVSLLPVADVPERVIPDPPPDLLPDVMEQWEAFWQSDVSQVIQPENMAQVRRLFLFYDQYSRAMAVARKALAVKGSTGQIRVNPLADHALKLDASIVRLENELGLTPLSRARLGLTIGQAQLTVEEVNRMAMEGGPRAETHAVVAAELADEWDAQ